MHRIFRRVLRGSWFNIATICLVGGLFFGLNFLVSNKGNLDHTQLETIHRSDIGHRPNEVNLFNVKKHMEKPKPQTKEERKAVYKPLVNIDEEAEILKYYYGLIGLLGNATENKCGKWCRRGINASPPYILSAVLLVRIYPTDPAKLSTRELRQWLIYLRFAGVEHVYVYDAYQSKNESQAAALGEFIRQGYITYIDWSKHAKPYTIAKTQISAYRNCVNTYKDYSIWQLDMDIDEYPFVSIDTDQNFLVRYINTISENDATIGRIKVANHLFLGKPLPAEKHPFLIDRITRRTPKESNNLNKNLYRTNGVSRMGIHSHAMKSGTITIKAKPDELRMNHYWGARLQNWGEDTPEIMKMTIPDESIRAIVKQIQACDWCIGPDILYEHRWN